MKKVIPLLAISALLVGTLAGCGGNASKTDNVSTTAPKEKVELTMWTYFENANQKKVLDDWTRGFNGSQSEIEVSHEYVPFADFKKQLSVGLAANELPDVVIIDNPDMASYAAMGLFADITDKISDWADKDQYFEGPWNSTMLDGKNYGIPMVSNCLALYYNEEMFAKAGVKPPETWDELREVAKKVTGNGVSGLGIAAPKTEEGTFQFLPWLLSSGATVEKVDGDEGIRSFTVLADMIKDGSLAKESINWTQSDVSKQFMVGKLAMMVNGPWQIPTLESEAPDLKWNVVKIPKDKQFSSVLGGENIGVVKGKNVDAAVKFIKYIGQADIVKQTAIEYGAFPPRKDVAQDKTWTDDPVLKVFMDEMQYAMPRGPHPQWPEISNAMSTALQETLILTKTPEQAAKDAQEKIDKID
jgi:multiple sugar transport system substrate-binding protein